MHPGPSSRNSKSSTSNGTGSSRSRRGQRRKRRSRKRRRSNSRSSCSSRSKNSNSSSSRSSGSSSSGSSSANILAYTTLTGSQKGACSPAICRGTGSRWCVISPADWRIETSKVTLRLSNPFLASKCCFIDWEGCTPYPVWELKPLKNSWTPHNFQSQTCPPNLTSSA